MKKIILLLVIVLMIGCSQDNKTIEIVPNDDEIYFTQEEVSLAAKSSDEYFFPNVVKEFKKIATTLHDENIEKRIAFPMSYRIYIDEFGKISKLKKLGKTYTFESKTDSLIEDGEIFEVYRDNDKINQKVIQVVQNWHLSPAQILGKNVKYRTDLLISILTYPGNIKEPKVQMSNLEPFFTEQNLQFFISAEEMPSPIGGIKAIQEKIVYPETAKKEGIEGRVYIKAFINENGDVVSAEVIKGIGAGCDESAMQAVKKTKFIPGRQNGKAVKVQVSIPILFKLSDDKFKGESKILGKWEGKSNKGEKIKISFFNDGLTNLYKSQSGIVDGKRTGATFAPTYKIDSTTTPYKLDLELNEHTFSKSLLKFITRDSIVIGRSLNKNIRPQNFNQDNIYEIWKLKRVK